MKMLQEWYGTVSLIKRRFVYLMRSCVKKRASLIAGRCKYFVRRTNIGQCFAVYVKGAKSFSINRDFRLTQRLRSHQDAGSLVL